MLRMPLVGHVLYSTTIQQTTTIHLKSTHSVSLSIAKRCYGPIRNLFH